MAPRPDISDQRRQQIMEAALAVFSREGFEHASMDDIARQAGVSKGALYLYYKSKDAIIATLLRIFFEQALQQIRLRTSTEDSVVAQLMSMTRVMIHEMERMVSIQPITLQFYAIAARHAEVRKHLRAYFADYRTFLEEVIHRGISQGELRATINSTDVAISLSALFEGLALLWIVDPQATDWPKQMESSTRLLLRAVMSDPDSLPGLAE